MDGRQAAALAHPLARANDHAGRDALTYNDPLPGGLILRSILAIDR